MMRTSGLFESQIFDIHFDGMGQKKNIVFFSDIHFGSPHFCKDSWREFKAWCKRHPENYYIGNGDYGEWYKAHTRAMLLSSMLPEELQAQDEIMMNNVLNFRKEIEFMQDRIIGLGEGNHGWQFGDNRTDAEVLADEFGAKFLGVMCVIQINCIVGNSSTPFLIQMHHGIPGSSQTAGGPYNAVEKLAKHSDGVTIYAMGDDHNCGILPGKPKMRWYKCKKTNILLPKSMPQYFVRTGGYTKHHEPGMRGYITDKAMGPTTLGSPYFTISMHRSRSKRGPGLRIKFRATANCI